jgi:hypothetical protein
MGKIEQKIRNSKLQKTILLTLEMGGLTALAIFAPNVIFALKKMGIITHKREIESIKRTQQMMYEKGLISLKKRKCRNNEKWARVPLQMFDPRRSQTFE